MALPKEHRVTKQKELEAVFAARERVQASGLIVKKTKNTSSISRFAVVISKKVSKKAVVRNRIRRLLHEVIRMHLGTMEGGWDVAIIVFPGFAPKSRDDATNALLPLLKRACLIP